jgi:hypothetical protein
LAKRPWPTAAKREHAERRAQSRAEGKEGRRRENERVGQGYCVYCGNQKKHGSAPAHPGPTPAPPFQARWWGSGVHFPRCLFAGGSQGFFFCFLLLLLALRGWGRRACGRGEDEAQRQGAGEHDEGSASPGGVMGPTVACGTCSNKAAP